MAKQEKALQKIPRNQHEHFAQFLGTTLYGSLEIIKGEMYRRPEAEIWAFRVLLYIMVFGESPFHNEDQIAEGTLRMPKGFHLESDRDYRDDAEFEELKGWYIEHTVLIDGAETLRHLVFLADSGMDQASMDRWYSNLGADEIGQEWVQEDKSPHQLADTILDLRRSRFEEGTRIWNLYKSKILPQSQLTQAESKVLSAAIVKK
ncbi:hypothetical protein HDU77_004192 [Chytriomyces hyalinus]|nr:hypothetical protein HDU77_004192 [Chytriomyces hyalinus]